MIEIQITYYISKALQLVRFNKFHALLISATRLLLYTLPGNINGYVPFLRNTLDIIIVSGVSFAN